MSKMFLATTLLFSLLLFSCDDGILEIEYVTANVSFSTESVQIETTGSYIPVIIKASAGNSIEPYDVYIEVDDPDKIIGSYCKIGNDLYYSADRASGETKNIYIAPMSEGRLMCAVMVLPVAHSGENIERRLSMRIIPDPLSKKQRNGTLYYTVGAQAEATAILPIQ